MSIDSIGILKRINSSYAERLLALFIEKCSLMEAIFIDIDDDGAFVSFEEDIFNATSVVLRYELGRGLILESNSSGQPDTNCMFRVIISPTSHLIDFIPPELVESLSYAAHNGQCQALYPKRNIFKE